MRNFKVFSRGHQRESLVDMQADPGETIDLATAPEYRVVLLQHRELLAQFGREQQDPLVPTLLADHVKPIPFPADTATTKAKAATKRKRAKTS